ncbi:DNA polymerase III subunit delta [Patescibacteria group bacterium]|nr:DNA polymerase III subunit delta [Patescibacteria group bacterium]
MLIFLYGPDSYRSRQKLNEIISGYKKTRKSGLNLSFIDCEEDNISIIDLKNKIRQSSMFKEKKLIIISNLFSSAKSKDEFLKGIKDFSSLEDIIIIYEKEDVKKSDPLFKCLKKNSESQEFKILKGAQIKNWVEKEIKKKGGLIESSAEEMLINYIGDDLWRMANEIQKLTNFKKNKAIATKDIELLVRPKIETDIFKTIDAIAQKNKKQALNLLHRHLEKGDPPFYLLSMVGYQFRNLLIVRDLMERNNPYQLIIKKSGLHPFVVNKTYSQARQFSLSELKKIYQKIFQVDLDAKTGKIDQTMALDLLIAGI